jgi:hypothetical protein
MHIHVKKDQSRMFIDTDFSSLQIVVQYDFKEIGSQE